MKKDEYLKWTATVVSIIGSFINSLGIYPLGPIILIFSGFIWFIVSVMWKEPSLIVTNVVLTLSGIIGLIWVNIF